MTIYTYPQLMEMTETELRVIKERKVEEYNIVQNRKIILAGNIMSLQGLIDTEVATND